MKEIILISFLIIGALTALCESPLSDKLSEDRTEYCHYGQNAVG